MKRFSPVALIAVLSLAASSPVELQAQDRKAMESEVRSYTRQLVSDLSRLGPMAWLEHFERGPDFYMASDGARIFPDYATADSTVRSFAPRIETIQLFLDALDVYPVTDDVAHFASPFRQMLLDTTGVTISLGGFVSGTVVRSGEDWRIRNLHWSSRPAAAQPARKE